MKDDFDFDEQLISERNAQVQQIMTQREKEPHKNISYCNTARDYSSFDVRKLLLQTSNEPKSKNFNSVIARSVKFQQHKQIKIKEILQQKDKNMMKQCTFKPKVNKSFGSKKRSVKQFLQSQQQFVKKVGAKKDQMKKDLKLSMDDMLKSRTIKRTKTFNNHSNESVYDRLYNKSKQNNEIVQFKYKQTFAPLISERSRNMARDLPISEHLYTDAMRRKQDQATRQSLRTTFGSETTKPLSLKTQMYAGQKFIKQFYYTAQQLELEESVDFDEFIKLLRALGFVTLTLEETLSQQMINNKQFNLVHEAYSKIQSVDLTLRNICVLLLSLLGIHYLNPIQSTDQPVFTLSLEESKKIKNRLSMEQLKKTVPAEQFLFQPAINQKSEVLAGVRRHKIIQQTEALLEKNQFSIDINTFNHVDLLHLNKINKQIQIMKRRQQHRQKDMKQCTFHPLITWRGEQDPEAGTKKCDQLYNLSKLQPERQNKTGQEVEFQKNKKLCTFKPKINKDKKLLIAQPAKNFQKTIVRMHQARKLKQQKNKKLGIHPIEGPPRSSRSSRSSIHSHSQSRCEPEQPFLVIDINIGDRIQQLNIYKNDLGKQIQLAHEFSKQHGIDEAGQQRLTQLLKRQINAILDKIQEQDEQYEQSYVG